MKHLLSIILIVTAASILFMSVEWRDVEFNVSLSSFDFDSRVDVELTGVADEDLGVEELQCETVMYSNGHSFAYKGEFGEVVRWDGWYFDSIHVGDNIMLRFDSIAPSKLKLSLITRDLIVDMDDSNAARKILQFLNPLEGFNNFRNNYVMEFGFIENENQDSIKSMGYYSFVTDFATDTNKHIDMINQFICDLSEVSEIETADVPGLSAFYAGFHPAKYYRPLYSGSTNNMRGLSDYLADKVFENWKISGVENCTSSEARLEIRANIVNQKFVTVSKYEFEVVGMGHGMYTETFHTLDLSKGKKLTNTDLFKTGTLDKVKMALFETMAIDSKFREWQPDENTAEDVFDWLKNWHSLNPMEDIEGESQSEEYIFELPTGALTETGVVFSFQPYEICCWAAGTFHFIVQYEVLKPYMTSKALRLIK